MPAFPSRFAARVRTAVPGAVIAGALAGGIAGMVGVFLLEHAIDGWWSRCQSEPTLGPASTLRVASPARPAAR